MRRDESVGNADDDSEDDDSEAVHKNKENCPEYDDNGNHQDVEFSTAMQTPKKHVTHFYPLRTRNIPARLMNASSVAVESTT